MTRKSEHPYKAKVAETSRRKFLKTGSMAAGSMLLGAAALKSQERTQGKSEEGKEKEYDLLFVQSAKGVVLKNDKLTLKGISPMTLFFTDRPERIAGHLPTEEFLLDWKTGGDEDNFSTTPPNAVVSIFGSEEIMDTVVELVKPKLDGDDLHYQIKTIEGDIPAISGPCSVFIDPIGRPLSPTSIAGVHRRHRRRARRRHIARRW